jgi:hypothetical protein
MVLKGQIAVQRVRVSSVKDTPSPDTVGLLKINGVH